MLMSLPGLGEVWRLMGALWYGVLEEKDKGDKRDQHASVLLSQDGITNVRNTFYIVHLSLKCNTYIS